MTQKMPTILCVSPKDAYVSRRLVEEANLIGIIVEIADVHELAAKNFDINIDLYDAIFVRQAYPHFKEVAALAKKFKVQGKVVVDANIVEGIGQGKFEALQKLSSAKLSTPPTQLLSQTTVPHTLFAYPLVLKWIYGFGGEHTHLISSSGELEKIARQYSQNELMVQEFVEADYEYKVITLGYKSLPVVLKLGFNAHLIRPDYARCEVVSAETAESVVRLAETASKILGRELAKTDILEKDGVLYVLEVNRWPGLEVFEEYSGHNAAKDFVAYLKSRLELVLS
jgi:glutathione synthase/RimK-type ligase-like ATP-grasp enzyme